MSAIRRTLMAAGLVVFLVSGGSVSAAEFLLTDAPGYSWTHGCGPTAGIQLFGYYDAHGYGNFIPGTNDWTTNGWNIRETCASGWEITPETWDASMIGTSHVADYAFYEGVDDYGSWPPHRDMSTVNPSGAHANDCLADFMKTSWAADGLGSPYGSTWNGSLNDGMVAFAGYKGYSWSGDYEVGGLFGQNPPSWDRFTTEINHGRPTILCVDSSGDGIEDHYVTAIGYRDINGYPEYACRDTWNPNYVRWQKYQGSATVNQHAWGIAKNHWFVPNGTNDTSVSHTTTTWAAADWFDGAPTASSFVCLYPTATVTLQGTGTARFLTNKGELHLPGTLNAADFRNANILDLEGGTVNTDRPLLVDNGGYIIGHGTINNSVELYDGSTLFCHEQTITVRDGVEAPAGTLINYYGGVLDTPVVNLDGGSIEGSTMTVSGDAIEELNVTNGGEVAPLYAVINDGGTLNHTGAWNVSQYLYVHGGTLNMAGYNLTASDHADGNRRFEIAGTGSILAKRLLIGENTIGTGIQSGGTIELSGATNADGIQLGYNAGSTGTYTMSGGSISAVSAYVGRNGVGTFTQTGGDVDIAVGLFVGTYDTSDGSSYEISDGELTVRRLWVGQQGEGSFTQSGGVVNVTGTTGGWDGLWLGRDAGGVGTYTITGGTLNSSYNIYVGTNGTATLNYGGGTINAPAIHVSANGQIVGTTGWDCGSSLVVSNAPVDMGANMLYLTGDKASSFTGGSLTAKGLTVGHNGTGSFSQSGASVTLSGSNFNGLTVGYGASDSGTYTLGSGSLSAGSAYVGRHGTGVLQQNSGSLSIWGENASYDGLCLGRYEGSDGTYNLAGGSFEAEYLHVGQGGRGEWNIQNASADVMIDRQLTFGADSHFSAVPGSEVHMVGASLFNASTDASELAGLADLDLIFEGGDAIQSTIEAAGADLGATDAGYVDNFALDLLQIGGSAGSGNVKLLDVNDNQLDGLAEALYVDELDIQLHAQIDLNDLGLYYRNGGSVKKLLHGDGDLDGDVDATDLATLGMNWNPVGTVEAWSNGDCDGDGDIDATDLATLGMNWNPLGTAAIPEPGSAILLSLGALGFVRRRRKLA